MNLKKYTQNCKTNNKGNIDISVLSFFTSVFLLLSIYFPFRFFTFLFIYLYIYYLYISMITLTYVPFIAASVTLEGVSGAGVVLTSMMTST